MLKQQVRDLDPAPGVIAYLDGEAVGWRAVEPRPSYRRLDRMRILKGSPERPDDDSVWAVTCFVVRVGFRKRGVGRALLAGAVDHARRGGARVVEGYPVDPAQREKVSSAELPGGTTVVKSRSPPRPNVVAFEVATAPPLLCQRLVRRWVIGEHMPRHGEGLQPTIRAVPASGWRRDDYHVIQKLTIQRSRECCGDDDSVPPRAPLRSQKLAVAGRALRFGFLHPCSGNSVEFRHS